MEFSILKNETILLFPEPFAPSITVMSPNGIICPIRPSIDLKPFSSMRCSFMELPSAARFNYASLCRTARAQSFLSYSTLSGKAYRSFFPRAGYIISMKASIRVASCSLSPSE